METPSFQVVTAFVLTSIAFLLTVGEVVVRWLLPGEPWDPRTRASAKAPPATCRLKEKKAAASEDPQHQEAPSSVYSSPMPAGAASRLARSPYVTPGGKRRSSQPGLKRHAAVVESWLAELLEALSLDAEDDTAGFGFVVSTSKAPKPSDLPRLIVKNSSLRSVRTGEVLLSVDGVRVAGMTARKVKELVSKASLRLRLSVLADVGEQARDVEMWRGRVGAVVALWEAIQRYDGRIKSLPDVEPPQPLELQLRATLKYFTELLADLDDKDALLKVVKAKHASSAGLERAILALISTQLLASHTDENASPAKTPAASPARQPLKESFAQADAPEAKAFKYASPDEARPAEASPTQPIINRGGAPGAHSQEATPSPAHASPGIAVGGGAVVHWGTQEHAERAFLKEAAAFSAANKTGISASKQAAIGKAKQAAITPISSPEPGPLDVRRVSIDHVNVEHMSLMARYNVLLRHTHEELSKKDATILDLQSRYNLLLQSVRLAGRGSSVESGETPSAHSSDVEYSSRGPCVSVMRHGQRLDEVDDGWAGGAARPYDPPLTETGRQQAFERGMEIGEARGAEVVVASPFLRCLQTAQEVIRGLQAASGGGAAPRLHVDFGLCEVLTSRNMHGQAPVLLRLEELDPELQSLVATPADCAACAQGGDANNTELGCAACSWGGGGRVPAYPETLEEAARRYREAFGRVVAAFPGREVLCVAHGDTVAQFAAETRGVSKDDVYEVPHCSLVSASKVGGGVGGAWRRGEIMGNVGILDFD